MAEVTYKSGDPIVVDYTPGSAVAAGEVVIVGDLTYIATRPIAASTKGALHAGGGVYEGTKTAGSSTAVTGGTKLYWDDSGNKPTATAGSNKVLGRCVPDGASDDDTVIRFIHDVGA